MAKNLNKFKRYSLREDLTICQTASSTALPVRALARLLARKLHRTPEGIETRIEVLRGQRKGVPATDNGIRLNGTPKNFLIDAPVNVNTPTPKFKRGSLPVLEPVSAGPLTITINGATITGSAETLRTLLNLQ